MKNASHLTCLLALFCLGTLTLFGDYAVPSQFEIEGMRIFLLPKEPGKPATFTFDKCDRNGRPGADILVWVLVSPSGQEIQSGRVPDDGVTEASWGAGPRQTVNVDFLAVEEGPYQIYFPIEIDAVLRFDQTKAENLHWGFENTSFRTDEATPIHAWFYLPPTTLGEPASVEIASNYLHYSRITNLRLATPLQVFYDGFTNEIPPVGEKPFTCLFKIPRTAADSLYELTADEFYVISFAPRNYPPIRFFFDHASAVAFKPFMAPLDTSSGRLELSAAQAAASITLAPGQHYRMDWSTPVSEVEILGKRRLFDKPQTTLNFQMPEQTCFVASKFVGKFDGTLIISPLVESHPEISEPPAGAVVTPDALRFACVEVLEGERYYFEFEHESNRKLRHESATNRLVLTNGALEPGVWKVRAAGADGVFGAWSTFAVSAPTPTSPIYAYGFRPAMDSAVPTVQEISLKTRGNINRISLKESYFLLNGNLRLTPQLLDGQRIGVTCQGDLPTGLVSVLAVLLDMDGNYSEYSWGFTLGEEAEKRLAFDENGYLLFNGRPFIPLILYPPNTGAVEGQGFNTYLPNTLEPLPKLDLLLQHNLKSLDSGGVYKGLYTTQDSTPAQDVERYMAGIGGIHPARLGAWMDEPDAFVSNSEISQFLEHYRRHSLDSGVTSICCTGRNRYAEMATLADVLIIDVYPRHNVLSCDAVFAKARQDANGKPVWTLNQGFDYDSSVEKAKDFTPTVQEARYAHWAALRHGHQGVGLYQCWTKTFQSFPELFEQLCETYRQTATLAFMLPDAPQEGLVEADAPVNLRVARHGSRVYVIAQNSSLEPREARFLARGSFAPKVRVLFEDRTLRLAGDGSFRDVFQPLDSRIYELEYAEPRTACEGLFQGETLIVPRSSRDSIMFSAVIVTRNRKIIVFDGGRYFDWEHLLGVIKRYGDTVDCWYLTHAHDDHVGALLELFRQRPGALKVRKLLYNFLPFEVTERHEKWAIDEVQEIYRRLPEVQAEERITIRKGDHFEIDGVGLTVLNDVDPAETVNVGNNASLACAVELGDRRLMVTGDIGVETGRRLVQEYGAWLKSDIVFMAHHGQNGADQEYYAAVSPEIAIWPTPTWLWDNDNGGGPGSGSWQTNYVKCWLQELGVKRQFINTDDLYFR